MKGKILIADDEARIRILVSDFLENEGYEVIEAKDGQEALDLFYQHKDCQLIILDVMMPFYDGFEVVKEIRPLTDTPILMLTARTAENDELRGFNLGVDDYVRKPLAQLYWSLESMLFSLGFMVKFRSWSKASFTYN